MCPPGTTRIAHSVQLFSLWTLTGSGRRDLRDDDDGDRGLLSVAKATERRRRPAQAAWFDRPGSWRSRRSINRDKSWDGWMCRHRGS